MEEAEDVEVTPRKRASSAGSEFSPSLFFKSLGKETTENFSKHFQLLGMTISLEQMESDEDDENEEVSMEMNSFTKKETGVERYRRAIKEYYAKELENNMIEWKRIHKQGTYIEYLLHAVPGNALTAV